MKYYVILSLVLLSILSSVLYYNTVMVDTQSYVLSTYYLEDKALQDVDTERVIDSYTFKRPIEIFGTVLLEPLLGVRQAYSSINVLLFIAATLLTYLYCKKLTDDETGYVSGVLFALSLPMILYASRVLVDVAGYLTLIIGLLVIEKILEKKVEWYHHAIIALLLGVFLLVRDTAVVLYPYFALRFIIKEKSLKSVWKLWPFIITLLPQFIFMSIYNVGFLLSGKSSALTPGKYSLMGWLKFLIVHIAACHLLLIFALFTKYKNKIFAWTYGISAFIYIVGIQLVALTSPRFSVVLLPLLLPFAASGIILLSQKTKNPHTTLFLCILIYGVVSFIGGWLYPSHTMIAEDAGGNVVVQAVITEIQQKIGGLL